MSNIFSCANHKRLINFSRLFVIDQHRAVNNCKVEEKIVCGLQSKNVKTVEHLCIQYKLKLCKNFQCNSSKSCRKCPNQLFTHSWYFWLTFPYQNADWIGSIVSHVLPYCRFDLGPEPIPANQSQSLMALVVLSGSLVC